MLLVDPGGYPAPSVDSDPDNPTMGYTTIDDQTEISPSAKIKQSPKKPILCFQNPPQSQFPGSCMTYNLISASRGFHTLRALDQNYQFQAPLITIQQNKTHNFQKHWFPKLHLHTSPHQLLSVRTTCPLDPRRSLDKAVSAASD